MRIFQFVVFLFWSTLAYAQTTNAPAPTTNAPVATGGGWGWSWLWIIVLIIIIAAAVWYFTKGGRPTDAPDSAKGGYRDRNL